MTDQELRIECARIANGDYANARRIYDFVIEKPSKPQKAKPVVEKKKPIIKLAKH